MRLDTKEILEERYVAEDPFGYQSNPWDAHRKKTIIDMAEKYSPFRVAVDIGAGEGWITRHLPAGEIYGYEISDKAAARFPKNVARYKEEDGLLECDLVLASGVFYRHNDWSAMSDLIDVLAKHIIITCHITEAEIVLPWLDFYQVEEETFNYRDKTETLRVYNVASAQY